MTSPQWCFACFRLDPDNAYLWRDTEAVSLPPKIFAVLHYLVTHPDRLVRKDELLDAVWPETAVTEAVLRVAIGAVRKVLGDTAQTPRFIATVPRRGYRFLVPVEAHTDTAPGPTGLGPLTAPQMLLAAAPDAAAPPAEQGLTPSPGALPAVAERRRLTVLCCNLLDFPTLAGQLDPEDLQEVVRAYRQACAEVLQRFDGYLAHYLGDGMLVYFGYPVAHEDDAQRAVWTGLGILEAMDTLTPRLTLPHGERVAVQLGMHTGLAVVGDMAMGAHHEPLALGETPHIAERLQRLAVPNTLLISAATYQLIEGYFTCEAVGEQTFRGLAQPLRAYRVLRASGAQSRFEVAAARGLTPLVGRGPEVELLVERWARVKQGMGQVVMLEGEAGIGKSRLVQVLKEHVASEAHTCWECRGVPYYQHTAWYPVIEFFQRWLQWRPGEAPGVPLGKLEVLLAQAQLMLAETVPLVAGLLALPLPAERYAPRSLPPEQERQDTLDVLLTLMGALAEQQPVLMIVEDLHWVDPSTLELLARLIDQVPTARIYTVLTCRPGFQPPWGFRTHLTPLTLNRLTRSQAEVMVQQILEEQPLPIAVLQQIVEKTDGIPLFVEEMTKAMLEAGSYTAVQAQDSRQGPLPALTIPTTLYEALLARLDRLGSAKGVAQLGATLGRQFSYTLLRAVTLLEDEPLQRALAALVAAELLYQRGQPPRAVYMFKHALLQEAAYESLLKRVRLEAHRRIVQVLEAQLSETVTTASELAYHALRGELWAQALAYFRQAGEHAVARSAYQEAVAAFEQALEIVPHLPEGRVTLTQAIDLRLALHSALYLLGEHGRVFVNLQDAQALAEALGDAHRLGWVATYLLAHFAVACAPAQALVCGQRALAIASDLGEVGMTVTAQTWLGSLYRSLGDYRRSMEFYQMNVAALHGALRHEYFGLPGPASALCHSHLVAPLAECGAFPEGRAHAEEAVHIAEAADHPYSRALAYWAVGFRALRQGDLPQALPVLERSLDVAQGAHVQLLVPWVAASLGAAYTLAERTADALALLEQAVEQAAAVGFILYHAVRVIWLGEAYLLAGRLEEASTQAQRALQFSRAHQERGHEAYALRLLGDIAARREPTQRVSAETYYQQALALAEELGMRPLVAHCHHALGRLYGQTGRRASARAALSAAIALYRAMDMIFWLPQAEAVLAQVEAGETPESTAAQR
jgi:class 3 adenylate cyclase/DNA-binding winged helix-turn-helix (wHTH) protein/tetratricopeptide (TPR) repeat protein